MDPLRLSPSGRLSLTEDADALDAALAARLRAAFVGGTGAALLHLGGVEINTALPPVFAWWRTLGARYLTAVCTRPEPEGAWIPIPPQDGLSELANTAPPMPGAEYLTAELLSALWVETDAAFAAELRRSGNSVQTLLKRLNPAWNVVGRVHFNLAENRRDADLPFAFLATYTPRLSAHGKAQHKPLGQAVRETADAADKDQLLSLLVPIQRAAEGLPWLRTMIDNGAIFHPLRWSAREAFRFLGDVPALERAGVIVRMPATWRSGRPPRAVATATVGSRPPSTLGLSAMLDFTVSLSLDGEPLTGEEVKALLAGSQGLALIRGQWVEVDPERLQRMMARFNEARQLAAELGLPFAEAMRLLSGADIGPGDQADEADTTWGGVVAGPWLSETLKKLRSLEQQPDEAPIEGLRGTLRPYQQLGVTWLQRLTSLGLGACLADDMGLGKTLQILALLLSRRRLGAARRPSLLVAPASLLSNWAAEIERFTPGLSAQIAHRSVMPPEQLKALDASHFTQTDLVITTYGALLRLPWLAKTPWDLVIFDEAQAMKNPGSKQTRAAKHLHAAARISLTGTPIENRLGDLWSIFDVINPGLLGNASQFTAYTKRLNSRTNNPYGPLRALVSPYILRRLKTDRTVIADLPDKTELKAWCTLSRKQAALYQQSVADLTAALAQVEGIQRRGLVLSYLMRFKQICNHPSQWLGDSAWTPADSGKWARLRELCEVVAERQEKVLVFTQFTEVIPPLSAFLGGVFGRAGLILTGETPVKKRGELVAQFQQDEQVPFMLLSLKAGGTGLNLTAASHVIHFDRWWNPAVENQATDRAFRIGQAKNVLVHKFVCRGTVEDRIDALIASKQQLSRDILESGGEVKLTELDDAELLRIVSLDIHAALEE